MLAARPLAPEYRMVLFHVARSVADGQTEALVNRAATARDLDTRPALVSRALAAGEALGLCRIRQNGRVAFAAYDTQLGQEPTPIRATGTREAPPDPQGERPVHTPGQVMGEFAKQWRAKYRTTYVFTPGRDHKVAKALAGSLLPEDLARRIGNYLTSPNPFYAESAHSFSLFAQRVNEFVAYRPTATASRVPNADQTAAYIARMRAR